MSGDWVRWEGATSETRREAYRFEPHSIHTPRRMGWLHYCKKCGLVRLKNALSEWAWKVGCMHSEHPENAKRVKSA